MKLAEYKKAIKRSESDEQCEVFAVLAANEALYPDLRWIHASMNGASASSAAAAGLRKRQGQKKGIADIFIPIQKNGFLGAWIEMKVKPNKLTPEQIDFMIFLEQRAYEFKLAYSAAEALEFIEMYLGIKLRRPR